MSTYRNTRQVVTHWEVLASIVSGKHTAEKIADDLVVSTSTVRKYANELVVRGWVVAGLTARQKGRRRITSKAYLATERGHQAYADGEEF
jgi:predicted ArsR family transcriptional regulator